MGNNRLLRTVPCMDIFLAFILVFKPAFILQMAIHLLRLTWLSFLIMALLKPVTSPGVVSHQVDTATPGTPRRPWKPPPGPASGTSLWGLQLSLIYIHSTRGIPSLRQSIMSLRWTSGRGLPRCGLPFPGTSGLAAVDGYKYFNEKETYLMAGMVWNDGWGVLAPVEWGAWTG